MIKKIKSKVILSENNDLRDDVLLFCKLHSIIEIRCSACNMRI